MVFRKKKKYRKSISLHGSIFFWIHPRIDIKGFGQQIYFKIDPGGKFQLEIDYL